MSGFDFSCQFCGKDFGPDVVSLARHIGDEHDRRPPARDIQ